MRVELRVTLWFWGLNNEKDGVVSEIEKNGRRFREEKYQDFGYKMLIDVQVEILGRQLDI